MDKSKKTKIAPKKINKASKKQIINYIKIGSIVLSAIIVFSFVVFQVTTMFNRPLKTQTVLAYTETEEINADIFVVRNESYITGDASGIYVPLAKNGERVAGGDTVSVVVENEETAALIAKKKQIEEDIAYYKNLSKISVLQTVDIGNIDKEISNNIYEYASILNSGKLIGLKEAGEAVRESIAHRQIVTGVKIDYTSILASLESEYARILNASKAKTDIRANSAGYFVSEVDGYENTVPYQNVKNLDVDNIQTALNSKPSELPLNIKGKLISDFDWYLITVLDIKDIEALKTSRTIKIHLNTSGASDIKVSIYKINEAKDGKVPVVFKADTMNEGLTTIRKESVKIKLEEYSGYRIDNNAIRMIDGEKGVFIKRANLISFRKIEVLLTDELYSIVSKTNSQLKLYDEIILEGTDLYDGKVIT